MSSSTPVMATRGPKHKQPQAPCQPSPATVKIKTLALPETIKPEGYHKLAALMGSLSESAIFRRFGTLNMVNLLSLQAELVQLQVEFQDICHEDDHSEDPSDKLFSSCFRDLRNSAGGVNDEQWRKLLDIRKKLSEYNATLLQLDNVFKLSSPRDQDLQFFMGWFKGEKEGNCFLKSSEAFTWNDTADLVTLHKLQGEQDIFSRWLSSTLVTFYHKIWGRRRHVRSLDLPFKLTQLIEQQTFGKVVDLESGLTDYDTSSMDRFSKVVVTTMSSILPLVTTLALWAVHGTLRRIGVMIVFTSLFAAALATFTSARRIEIFAATAS
ncbi:hypothetical protein LSUE1_G007655 [Lachnellula suecica]|uniref:DUF6594 domain-containing protein n=1 Tax=Lachnellula suecica TaxID=602035 RepID=A0A8T9C4I6_9HELO|nr:hypothetical protein LSUE1_G007655 [Lachnellula suecica]